MRLLFLVLLVLAVGWGVGGVRGQTPELGEGHRLVGSDGVGGDFFAGAVALEGNIALVGAAFDDTAGGANAGSAYVYRFDGVSWVEEAHLLALDGELNDRYGFSVALSGEVALVGANMDDTAAGFNAGSVYVYRYDAVGASWVEEDHWFASDAAGGDQFGVSVAVAGDIALVGASGDGAGAGSVYVYRYDAVGGVWAEEDHLFASNGLGGDQFGWSVALSGEVGLVGAPFRDPPGGTNAGGAYVFRFDALAGGGAGDWVEEAALLAGDGTGNDRYGFSVAVDGGVGLVGAFGDNSARGSAYVYRYDAGGGGTGGWVEEDRLSASDGVLNDQFGVSVAVSGDLALVGANGDDASRGSAYAFRFDPGGGVGGTGGWVEDLHLRASDGVADDLLGISLALSGTVALVGANGDDGGAGSAYVFEGVGDCNGNGVDDAADIGTGFSLDLNGNGVPDECEADCNGNGVADFLDISSGASSDFNDNGVPDECDPDCNGNQLPDFLDIQLGISGDCNLNAVPDECEIADGVLLDCNGNGVADACDISEGTELDCDLNGIPDSCDPDCNGNLIPDACDIASGKSTDQGGNGIPDECEGDCNGNGVPDDFDISSGFSADCNSNLIPDECDITSGVAADCNVNGILDSCDLVSGTSQDLDGNGVPDECDPDCNVNGIPDFLDILFGISVDINLNGVPDECDCRADIWPPGPPVGNGVVNIDDLVTVLNSFGVCSAPPASCDADIAPFGGNGVVNIDDLVEVLNGFGDCP